MTRRSILSVLAVFAAVSMFTGCTTTGSIGSVGQEFRPTAVATAQTVSTRDRFASREDLAGKANAEEVERLRGEFGNLVANYEILYSRTDALADHMGQLGECISNAQAAADQAKLQSAKNASRLNGVEKRLNAVEKRAYDWLVCEVDENRERIFVQETGTDPDHPPLIIRFPTGSAEITGEVESQMKVYASYIFNCSLTVEQVVGCSSQIGSATRNVELAEKRAQNALAYLTGFATGAIRIAPEAKTIGILSETDLIGVTRAPNQCAVIYVSTESASAPPAPIAPATATPPATPATGGPKPEPAADGSPKSATTETS